MLNSELLKSTNGKHYKIITPRDPVVSGSVTAEAFSSSQQAHTFIKNLQVNTGYWARVLQSVSAQAVINGSDSAVLDQTAHLISQGKIRIFEIKVQDAVENPPQNRVVKKEGVIYRFAPSSEQVTNPRLVAVKLSGVKEANAYLDKIDADDQQLRTLAKALDISTPASAGTAEVRQSIANAIAENKVVVSEDKVSKAPAAKKAEISDNPVGNVTAKAVTAGIAANAVVAESAAAEDTAPVCELTEFTVKCDHGSTVTMKAGSAGDLELNVVSSETHKKDFEKITASIKSTALCGEHIENSSSIQPQPERTAKAAASNIYTLSCAPLPNFFKSLWLPNLEPKRYKISPNTHIKFSPNAVSVNVYPKIKWTGKISYSFGEKESKRGLEKGQLKTTHKNIGGKFSGNLTRDYDGKQTEYIGEYKNSLDEVLTKLNWITQKVDKVLGYFDGGSDITLKVGWPNIEISYSSGLVEDNGNNAVVSDYEIKVGAAPLIDISGSVDLFPVLMKTIPATHGIYTILNEIKKGIGNEHGFAHLEGEISLVLSVGSSVGVNFTSSGTNGKEDNNNKVDSTIDIKFELAGSVKAKGHVWVIKIERSYKVGVKSGFVGKLLIDRDEAGYFWYSRFLFNGLIIYFTKYTKVEKSVELNAANQKIGNKSRLDALGVVSLSKESTQEWVWIEPDPDEEAPSETDRLKSGSEISASNKHYLIEFNK